LDGIYHTQLLASEYTIIAPDASVRLHVINEPLCPNSICPSVPTISHSGCAVGRVDKVAWGRVFFSNSHFGISRQSVFTIADRSKALKIVVHHYCKGWAKRNTLTFLTGSAFWGYQILFSVPHFFWMVLESFIKLASNSGVNYHDCDLGAPVIGFNFGIIIQIMKSVNVLS